MMNYENSAEKSLSIERKNEILSKSQEKNSIGGVIKYNDTKKLGLYMPNCRDLFTLKDSESV